GRWLGPILNQAKGGEVEGYLRGICRAGATFRLDPGFEAGPVLALHGDDGVDVLSGEVEGVAGDQVVELGRGRWRDGWGVEEGVGGGCGGGHERSSSISLAISSAVLYKP